MHMFADGPDNFWLVGSVSMAFTFFVWAAVSYAECQYQKSHPIVNKIVGLLETAMSGILFTGSSFSTTWSSKKGKFNTELPWGMIVLAGMGIMLLAIGTCWWSCCIVCDGIIESDDESLYCWHELLFCKDESDFEEENSEGTFAVEL